MWAILKSPIMMSADLDLVSSWAADPTSPEQGSGPELIEVLKNSEVLAVSDDPLGKEAVRLEDIPGAAVKSSPDVFVGEMEGGKFAACLLNRGGAPVNVTLSLQDLGLVADLASQAGSSFGAVSQYTVRDLWAHVDNGTVAAGGSITALVGKQDVVMISLTPA
jgi:hypothetical protein